MSKKWPKVSEVYTSKCPDCGKPGDVSRMLDEHGLRDNRDSYLVVHETGEDGYPDLFWNEIVSSCGPFRWRDIVNQPRKGSAVVDKLESRIERLKATLKRISEDPYGWKYDEDEEDFQECFHCGVKKGLAAKALKEEEAK